MAESLSASQHRDRGSRSWQTCRSQGVQPGQRDAGLCDPGSGVLIGSAARLARAEPLEASGPSGCLGRWRSESHRQEKGVAGAHVLLPASVHPLPRALLTFQLT